MRDVVAPIYWRLFFLAVCLSFMMWVAHVAETASASKTALAERIIQEQICSPTKGVSLSHHHDYMLIGKAGRSSKIDRVVRITMDDSMRFTPESLQARRGETIRFVVRNLGKVRHELVLGTESQLQEHNEEMKASPAMTHIDPNMVVVEPGRTGQIIWEFTRSGKINFACLQPGHFDSGMKGYVQVVPASGF